MRCRCRECNGSSFCEHNRLRSQCRDCGGAEFCHHGKWRSACVECGSSKTCHHHIISQCATLGNPKYDGYCTHCFGNVFPDDPRTALIRRNSKEIKWVNALLTSPILEGQEWKWDKTFHVDFFGGCCSTKRRIDLWTLIDDTIFAIEIDENQHKDRAPDYEATRYNDLFMDFSGRYIFLRINPDPYKVNGVEQDPSFTHRLALAEDKLADLLADLDERAEDAELVTVHHLFYDTP